MTSCIYTYIIQLKGGIHSYLEQYPDGGGLFEGRNFIFDNRITGTDAGTDSQEHPDGEDAGTDIKLLNPSRRIGNIIIGQCIDCNTKFDEYSGNVVCTVCRQPVLVCDTCRVGDGKISREYHCRKHRYVREYIQYMTI